MNKFIIMALLLTNNCLAFGSTVYHECANREGTIQGDPNGFLQVVRKSYISTNKDDTEHMYTESRYDIPEKDIISFLVVAEIENLQSSLGQSIVYAAKIKYINEYGQERNDFLICENVALASPVLN